MQFKRVLLLSICFASFSLVSCLKKTDSNTQQAIDLGSQEIPRDQIPVFFGGENRWVYAANGNMGFKLGQKKSVLYIEPESFNNKKLQAVLFQKPNGSVEEYAAVKIWGNEASFMQAFWYVSNSDSSKVLTSQGLEVSSINGLSVALKPTNMMPWASDGSSSFYIPCRGAMTFNTQNQNRMAVYLKAKDFDRYDPNFSICVPTLSTEVIKIAFPAGVSQ